MWTVARGLVPPIYRGFEFYDRILSLKIPMLLINPHYRFQSEKGEELNEGSPEYERVVKELPESALKVKMKPFIKEMGIREDVVFIEEDTGHMFSALGSNYFTSGDAVIFCSPSYKKVDEPGFYWCLKHELAHIKNNDSVLNLIVATIVAIASAIFITSFLPFAAAIIVDLIISYIATKFFGQINEIRADNFANEHATDEELLGARRFFKIFMTSNIDKRTDWWNKLIYTPSGDSRFSFSHPSHSSRLHKVEEAIKSRNITVNENTEDNKIKLLRKQLEVSSLRTKEKEKRATFIYSI